MPSAEDVLEHLRAALREIGYGELVQDVMGDEAVIDRSAATSLGELIAALENGPLPAMRATAEASRILAERANEQDLHPTLDPSPSDDPRAVRVPLDTNEAERLAAEADELGHLLAELRRSIDADVG